MKYIFIINPISGIQSNNLFLIDIIDSVFSKSNHYYEFVVTVAPKDAKTKAQDAVQKGFDFVVAVGGDGTVNEVASGIVNSEATLGIIPVGSGNGLARSYNIPRNIHDAIALLLNPSFKKVDAGIVNDHYFFGVCGTGFDAMIGYQFQQFGARGPIPYFFIGVKEFLRYKSKKYIIEYNNKRLEKSALLIVCANTEQYGNGAVIAPQADPADGLMEICIISKTSLIYTLKHLHRLFDRSIHKFPGYETFRARSVKISQEEKDTYYHTDGEPFKMNEKLNIEIKKSFIKLCVG